ncbi:MAG: hypothetical protein HQ481_11285 [Alphaproteobacteria bacterium]|nr:hypothetical protein [Alphaproteobacteria bacterium]
MSLLGRFLGQAVRRAAQDPRIRAKATELAGEAYRRAKPAIENAGRHVVETARETAAEVRPGDNPLEYAKRFHERLLPPDRDDDKRR